MCEQGYNLFFPVWSWELGLSVTLEANSSSTVSSTTCLPFLFFQLSLWSVSSSQSTSIFKNLLSWGKKKNHPLPFTAFSCFLSPYLSWKSYLNECSLFPSSLPHLPFATEPRICVHAKSLLLCPTLCDPMDCSPPDSYVKGIFQARILEWVVMSFSRGSFPPKDRTYVSLCLLHWQAGSLPRVPPGKPGQHLLISQEKRLRSLPFLFLPLTLGLEVYPTRGSDCALNPTLYCRNYHPILQCFSCLLVFVKGRTYVLIIFVSPTSSIVPGDNYRDLIIPIISMQLFGSDF